MKNPYIRAIERRMYTLSPGDTSHYQLEFDLLQGLLREFKKIDKQFSLPVVSKLRKVADQCESGGHKSRARMFRALAKEFEVKFK